MKGNGIPYADFVDYVNRYFAGIPLDKLCNFYHMNKTNNSRRIQKAIKLNLILSDGRLVTKDLYKKEQKRREIQNGLQIIMDNPGLPRIAAETYWRKDGRLWTEEEDAKVKSAFGKYGSLKSLEVEINRPYSCLRKRAQYLRKN